MKSIEKYNLRFRKVEEAEAINSIKEGRVCFVWIFLSDIEWENFINFYKDNRNRILTKKDLGKSVPLKEMIYTHTFVLVNEGENYLKFLNSWGENWGDNSYFKIKDSSVFDMQEFYEIY